ncbi:mandelate racemase/muconate lactonizing enzyme family protein [Treponema parvum]|uniref:Mandelate racemase/muconate lactonizing enzyme family protein n=1 Tax=Treponema parvum TaxID=138851 RepID=A0A975IE98_9SPIR|nr:mandelate racemase/muconate lactonizing enzyme family protein [Treponema parvum]QTQ13602.1 mandelate racemase/muconate lactonizing enzyme family protein [Treponema parvum]
MKISAVETIPLAHECKIPIADAVGVNRLRKALLIKINTDKGLWGIGEAFLYGCSLQGAKKILEDQFVSLLIGKNPCSAKENYELLCWNSMAFGRAGIVKALISGIDIALWDIAAKAEGLPVGKLLCKETSCLHLDKIPSYASGGFYAEGKDKAALEKEAEAYLKKGYSAVKIKIGRNPSRSDSPLKYLPSSCWGESVEKDIERIAAVRSVLGNERILMVDSNASFSAQGAMQILPSLIEQGVAWFEEPIRFEDEDGLKELRAAMKGRMQIAGFETAQGDAVFKNLIDGGCVDIVQADIGWAGGFTGCLKIAELAKKAGKKFSLHSFGSAVHFASSLHLASCLANTDMIESEENANALRSAIVKSPFQADPKMAFYVPEKEGLGIELDWDAVHSMRVL